MGSTKYDIEKFSGKNDFGLWRIKIRAILVQQGLVDALRGESGLSVNLSPKEKTEITEKAHSAIILCLGDRALREVASEKTAATIWTKLEKLYMTKSLANKLYLKQRLYSFKMTEEKTMSDQIDDFNKIIDDLENINIMMEDEDQALILLNAMPKTYEHFKDAMLYGREQTITLEEVQSVIRAKEHQRRIEVKEETIGEGLVVKEKRSFKSRKAYKGFQKNKNEVAQNGVKLKCFHCHKEGHFKKNCPDRKKKFQENTKDVNDSSTTAQGFVTAEVLSITDEDPSQEWILDSGCTYHMSPNKI